MYTYTPTESCVQYMQIAVAVYGVPQQVDGGHAEARKAAEDNIHEVMHAQTLLLFFKVHADMNTCTRSWLGVCMPMTMPRT